MVFRLRSAHRGGPSFFHGDRTRRIGEKRAYRADMKPEELKRAPSLKSPKNGSSAFLCCGAAAHQNPCVLSCRSAPHRLPTEQETLPPYLIGGYLGWIEHHLRSIVPYKVTADERSRALVLDVTINFAYAIIVFTLFFEMMVFLHDFIR